MDRTAQWPKEESFGKPMEGINTRTRLLSEEKRAIRSPQEHLNCPRCNSTNTKFCYYNNYSLTQPRYLCKTCKRYWTEGGSLRNVPVGGCSRKNKKSAAAPSTSPKIPDLNPVLSLSQFSSQNPRAAREAQVLNLAFQTVDKKYHGLSQGNSSSTSASSAPLPAFGLLRTGNIASRGLNTYIPSPMLDTRTLYYSSAGFHLQEPKSTPGFSVDGLGTRYEIQENSAKLFFPFGGSKQISSTNEVEQSKGQGISTGNWSHAMLNGGYW